MKPWNLSKFQIVLGLTSKQCGCVWCVHCLPRWISPQVSSKSDSGVCQCQRSRRKFGSARHSKSPHAAARLRKPHGKSSSIYLNGTKFSKASKPHHYYYCQLLRHSGHGRYMYYQTQKIYELQSNSHPLPVGTNLKFQHMKVDFHQTAI